jgi:hypothetical protein
MKSGRNEKRKGWGMGKGKGRREGRGKRHGRPRSAGEAGKDDVVLRALALLGPPMTPLTPLTFLGTTP